jgi:penicillin amidase
MAGYAVAQDRLNQIDMSRRSARGKLAEVLGQSAVASDKDALRFGYTDTEYEQLFDALPKLTRDALTNYAAGINSYAKESRAPFEPWEPADSLAIGVNLVRRFGRGGAGEIRNLLLHTYLSDRLKTETKKAFDDLLWQNDLDSPTTSEKASPSIPFGSPFPDTDPGAWERHVKLLPRVNMLELLPAIRLEEQSEMLALAEKLGVPHKWGSYAILANGNRATTPVLLNGPQMGFSTPSVVHQMSISAPGYKAVGMDIPGFPGIVIGMTEKSAWGATSGVADTDDIFFVELDPQDPTRYKHKDEWHKFETANFTINIKDGSPQTIAREMSLYGPVVLKSVGTGVAYVRKSSLWMQETRALSGILEQVAKNSIDFNKLAEAIPASFNLFGLGDNISWNYCGDVPLRSPRLDPRLPLPGTGEYDWTGIVPKAQMPRHTNPKSGLIVNWNNKPVVWWPNFDTPIWGSIFRNASIHARLDNIPKLTTGDLESTIREIAMEDSDAAALIPLIKIFPVRELTDFESNVFNEMLRWDAMKIEGTAAPIIYPLFYNNLRRELFEPKLGGMLNPSVFFLATQASLTRKALIGETHLDYLAGRTPADVIRAAIKKTAESLKASRGEDMSTWNFQDDGITWTGIRSIPYSNRGTYIQVIEKHRTGLVGRYIAPPGVSEKVESKHFSDQEIKAATWSLLPMEFKTSAGNRD